MARVLLAAMCLCFVFWRPVSTVDFPTAFFRLGRWFGIRDKESIGVADVYMLYREFDVGGSYPI